MPFDTVCASRGQCGFSRFALFHHRRPELLDVLQQQLGAVHLDRQPVLLTAKQDCRHNNLQFTISISPGRQVLSNHGSRSEKAGRKRKRGRKRGKGDATLLTPVDSLSKCTTDSLTKDLVGCLIAETFSWAMIQLFDGRCKIFRRDCPKVGSFWEVTA